MTITSQRKRLSLTNKVYLLIVMYALFAFNRIKTMGMPRVDGIAVSNMLVVIAVAWLFMAIFCKRTKSVAYENWQIVSMIILVMWTAAVSFVLTDNTPQMIYALLTMVLPLLLLMTVNTQTQEQFTLILKWLNFLALGYSVVTIVSSLNYGTVMELIGNNGASYGDHTRASLPLGSSISVSYYLNMSLPLALYLYTIATGKGKHAFYLLTVLLNVVATLLQLSRSASLMAVLILLFYLLFVRARFGFVRKVILFALVVFGAVWLSERVDLTRLSLGFFAENGMDDSRVYAYKLGAHLFSEHALLGTGMGAVFHRAWSGSNVVSVDGIMGLVDPHNAYILVLSELGIFGTIALVAFLGGAFRAVLKNQDKLIRLTGIMLLATMLGNSLVGSQLINESAFSTIAFVYLAVFIGRSFSDQKGNTNGEASKPDLHTR